MVGNPFVSFILHHRVFGHAEVGAGRHVSKRVITRSSSVQRSNLASFVSGKLCHEKCAETCVSDLTQQVFSEKHEKHPFQLMFGELLS